MSLTLDQVIRYLEGLSGEELGKLADEVLARVGAPPIARPVRPRHDNVTMGVPPPEMGIPEFDVVLCDHGSDKLAVIRVVRQALGPGVGLADVKKLVESAPVVILESVRGQDAREIAEALRAVGAVVEVR